MSTTTKQYVCCPSHCCTVHGCKYGHSGCPVKLKKVEPEYPGNNGCEQCEWQAEERRDDPEWSEALKLIQRLHAKAEPGSSERISAQNFLIKHNAWKD